MQPDPTFFDSPSRRLAVDVRRFPWIRRLASDYAFDFAALAPFFAGNPAEPGAWADTIARTTAHPRDRSGIAGIVAAQQERRGAPAEARQAAGRLADPRAVAIVTGQQAGLFGGPLYTLLKALTAVKLAARVERDHGVPAVAVFWIDSEDHDWDEVNSCGVLDADLERRVISIGTPPGAGEGPVASVRLDPSVFAAIEILRTTLPATEFTEDVLGRLSEAYRPGAGMSEAFGRWLEALLGGLGLVVYDSSDPEAKALVRDVFVRELEAPGTTTQLATGQGEALTVRGYHAQVVPHPDNVALFALEGVRRPIHVRDGAFLVGDGVVEAARLVEDARNHPERFSPNVMLRPVVQDTLFPTVCYVAGPNELAYLAQLRPVYERLGVPEPLMFQRASMTLLDSAAAKFLSRYHVEFEALQPDSETALNHLLEDLLPGTVERSFGDAARSVDSGMEGLIDALPLVDPTLQGAARSALGRMRHDLHALHDKILHAAKRRDDTLRRQYARTRAQAFPDGHPQERSVAFVYFLDRYGPALIERLHAEMPLDMGTHWVLAL